MTPETRAARDRLARYADPRFPMPEPRLPGRADFTRGEVKGAIEEIVRGIQETLAPDLRRVLAALDECDRPRPLRPLNPG